MKNLLLLTVALVVLLVLAGVAWLLVGVPAASPAAGGAPVPTETARADSDGPAADSALAHSEGDAEEERLGSGEGPEGGRAAVLPASGPTRLVRGRVRPPFGAPADPRLRAYALATQHEYDEFLEDVLAPGKTPLAEARVAADGAFELEVPAELERVHVIARGKFLYLPETVAALADADEELELEPRVGAHVAATVRTPAGTSASGTEAHLEIDVRGITERPDGRETFELDGVCDERGVVEFDALPPTYPWRLEVLPESLAAQRLAIEDLRPGEDRALDVELGEGGAVAGVVLDPAGEPAADATVRALLLGSAFGFDDREVAEGRTDATGRFTLEHMPVGELALRADHDEHLESKRVTVEVTPGGTTKDVELRLAQGGSIRGLVLRPDGAPAVDAKVLTFFDEAYLAGLSAFNALRGSEAETRTDAEGRFELKGLGGGPFVVLASLPRDGVDPEAAEEEGAPEDWVTARVESVSPGSEIELRLHGPLGIEGRVVDAEDEPLAAPFAVRAIRRADGAFGTVGREERSGSFEDEDGRFALSDVTEGRWELTVESDGFVTAEPVSVDAPGDDSLTIRVVRSASVSGRVLTPAGAPVGGATVRVQGGRAGWMAGMNTVDGSRRTESDSSGFFELEDLPPGSVALVADHDDYCEGVPQPFELTSGTRLEDAELRLREGGRLTGLVYDKRGERAAGYLVALNSNEMRQMFGRTDSEGEFVVENVPPGPWQVVAMNSGADLSADDDGSYGGVMGSISMSQAEIVEGETTHVVIGAPPENPVTVRGEVTHDGEPFEGASLIFFREGSKLYENMKIARFEEDGRYSVVVDGPGSYVVYLQKMGRTQMQQQSVEYSIEIPQVEEHVEDFEVPLGRVSGRVTGADGAPVAGARVTLATDGGFRSDVLMGGQYSEVQTDAEGRYDLVGLRPGTYMIAAGGVMLLDSGGASGGNVGRVTRGGLRLGEGEWKKDVDFRLSGPGSLAVRVSGLDGQPISDAAVFLRDSGGRPVEPFSFAATDATGICVVRGLAPGDYTVMARKDLASSQESPPVRVVEGERKDVSLRLEEGTVLWIQLRDENGEAVRASVSVRDEDGRDWAAFFGMEDLRVIYLEGGFSPTEHRLGPLPPGRYRIEARGDAGSKNKPVTLHGEPERKVILRLK